MKIGILTQPLTTNYGGILQNFALQKVLSDLGHDVYTIDYGKLPWLDYIHNWMSFVRIGFRGNRPETPIENENKQLGFRQFIGKHIRTTQPKTRKIDWKLMESLRLDTVVVGSNQVWRPSYNYDITAMFLKPIGDRIRKIAYAASFGTDVWEFTDLQTNECRELIKSFTGVSVREEDAVRLCKHHLFTVYGNNKRGNSRFNSLLGLFSLQNRLVASIPNEWPAIDWDTVNCAHKSKREESINWLMSKLCQK